MTPHKEFRVGYSTRQIAKLQITGFTPRDARQNAPQENIQKLVKSISEPR